MKRILVIMPWIRQGGAELIAAETTFSLGRIGYKVKLAALFVDTSDMGERASQIEYVVPPGWVSSLCRRNKWLLYFLGPFFLFFLVLKRAKEADVLFPHSLPADWIASVISRVLGKPVVWLCNEPPARISLKDVKTLGWADFIMWGVADSFLDRFFVKGVQRIIVYSDSTAKEVAKRYGQEPEVVRLGVDFEFFSKRVPKDINVLIKKYRLSNRFTLLMVGKFHPQENQRLAVEILAELIAEIPRVKLVFVGDGPDGRFLRRRVKSLGVEDYVIFAGFCPPKKVRAWYHLSDLVLFPPLPRVSGIRESWGFVPVEALCAKKLSVVSGGSGVAGVLGREKIGIVASPSVSEFTRQILQFYNAPSEFGALAERGFKYVRENLSWERYAERVGAVLAEAGGWEKDIS